MEISRACDFLGSTGNGADCRGWCFVWRDALRHFLPMDQAPNVRCSEPLASVRFALWEVFAIHSSPASYVFSGSQSLIW